MKSILEYLYNKKGAIKSIGKYTIFWPSILSESYEKFILLEFVVGDICYFIIDSSEIENVKKRYEDDYRIYKAPFNDIEYIEKYAKQFLDSIEFENSLQLIYKKDI